MTKDEARAQFRLLEQEMELIKRRIEAVCDTSGEAYMINGEGGNNYYFPSREAAQSWGYDPEYFESEHIEIPGWVSSNDMGG